MQFNSREDIIQLTPLWKGERLPDGRPYVSKEQLERLRKLTLEEVWQTANDKLYNNQYQEGFRHTSEKALPMVGRAVTCTMMPVREDLLIAMTKQAKAQGMPPGLFHAWVITNLKEDDVFVTNCHDKIYEGPMLGGNFSAAISEKTKRGGAVVWGSIRDLAQIEKIENINVFYHYVDPTPSRNELMVSYNGPCLIGSAVCLPGDIVYACKSGVFFLPAHLVEETITKAEKTQVKDLFGSERLSQGKYTVTLVDSSPWPQDMMDDFLAWFKTSPKAKPYQHLDWSVDLEETKKGYNASREREHWGNVTIDYNDPRLDE